MVTKTDLHPLPLRDEVISILLDRWDDEIAPQLVAKQPDPNVIVDQMVTSIQQLHEYDSQFGPFYDTATVREKLGITRQAVNERAKNYTLLRVITSDKVSLYPTFQFDANGVIPPIRNVINQFKEAQVDGWAVATWFTTPARDLGGKSPLKWISAGGDSRRVLDLADETARRWATP